MSGTGLELPIRVFLLVQSRLLRDTLERLLRKRADLHVVACSKPEECTPQAIIDSECDVIVMDFLDIRWLAPEIQLSTRGSSSPKSLLICMADDGDQFFAAVNGGAIGYLLKEASIAEVVTAIRAISRGEAVCPPRLCAQLFGNLSRAGAEPVLASSHASRPPLTVRQQRLAALVAKGLSNKEIAGQLNLSEFTVKNHLRRIMKRFGAHSRTQAVEAILSHGYSLANKSVMQASL